jgi:hypothetical protein
MQPTTGTVGGSWRGFCQNAGAALGSRDGAGSYGAYHGEMQQGAVTNLVAVAATAWSTMLQLELLKC